MLTAEGCRQRRSRFWQQLDPPPEGDYLILADPAHLTYLTGFRVDPISSSAESRAYLLLRRDGHTKLILDNFTAKQSLPAHVDEQRVVTWYDLQSPAIAPRQLAPLSDINPQGKGLRVQDRIGDPYAPTVIRTLAELRRCKDADEVEVLRRCMRATEAGHAWARANIRPGMTELDVYAGVNGACVAEAGKPVLVYGDFVVCPGPERTGGPPTGRVLQVGDLFILDFSVVIEGYRSDFTNTLAVGGAPNAGQRRLFDLCKEAMAAGEAQLRAGAACRAVFDALDGVFVRAGVADAFPHHGGHGLGLGHPEAPYIVRHGTETLLAGDVVTLEPGLYVAGIGGVRIENNYLILDGGSQRLSDHVISLT